MSEMMNEPVLNASTFAIKVKGSIDASWSDFLSGAQILNKNDAAGNPFTELRIRLEDQAALRGLLNHLWDLNLCVISVRRTGFAGQLSNEKEKK